MDVVTLHVFHTSASQDFGDLRYGAPSLAPDERVMIFDGLAPPAGPEDARLASVVLRGDLDGRRAYAEQVPDGVRLDLGALPSLLRRFVVVEVLRGLAALHSASQVHGAVGAQRVRLGVDGSVVLFGRGRRGGTASMDTTAALQMLDPPVPASQSRGDAGVAVEQLAKGLPDSAQAELGQWVRGALGPRSEVIEQIALIVAGSGAMDEVLPDIGPDMGGERGLLDRWAVTTSTGLDMTGEVTDGVGSGRQRLASTLWGRLAASGIEGSPVRFEEVRGVPSRGVRALLADEPPEPVPGPIDGLIAEFVTARTEPEDALPSDEFESIDGVDPPTHPTGLFPDDGSGRGVAERDPDVSITQAHPPTHRGSPPRESNPSRYPVSIEVLLGVALVAAVLWLVLQLL